MREGWFRLRYLWPGYLLLPVHLLRVCLKLVLLPQQSLPHRGLFMIYVSFLSST